MPDQTRRSFLPLPPLSSSSVSPSTSSTKDNREGPFALLFLRLRSNFSSSLDNHLAILFYICRTMISCIKHHEFPLLLGKLLLLLFLFLFNLAAQVDTLQRKNTTLSITMQLQLSKDKYFDSGYNGSCNHQSLKNPETLQVSFREQNG